MDEIPTIKVELMLAGWSVTHSGGAKVTFWVNDEDLEHFKTATVKKGNTAGQRYMAALVEIGPDEQPVQDRDKPKDALRVSAVMLCKNETFQRFASEFDTMDDTGRSAEDHAADTIRRFCVIGSRRELDIDPGAAREFRRLMEIYREWQEGNE